MRAMHGILFVTLSFSLLIAGMVQNGYKKRFFGLDWILTINRMKSPFFNSFQGKPSWTQTKLKVAYRFINIALLCQKDTLLILLGFCLGSFPLWCLLFFDKVSKMVQGMALCMMSYGCFVETNWLSMLKGLFAFLICVGHGICRFGISLLMFKGLFARVISSQLRADCCFLVPLLYLHK